MQFKCADLFWIGRESNTDEEKIEKLKILYPATLLDDDAILHEFVKLETNLTTVINNNNYHCFANIILEIFQSI